MLPPSAVQHIRLLGLHLKKQSRSSLSTSIYQPVQLFKYQQNIVVRAKLAAAAQSDMETAKANVAMSRETRSNVKQHGTMAEFVEAQANFAAAKAILAKTEGILRNYKRPRPASVCELRDLLLRDMDSPRCKTPSDFASGIELMEGLKKLCDGTGDQTMRYDALTVTQIERESNEGNHYPMLKILRDFVPSRV